MTQIFELTSKRVTKSGLLTSAMRRVMLALAALLIAVPGFAQTIDVSGNVTDNTGEPLIGVTVQVANSTIGAATDLDGNYTLKNVPSKGKLIFSYVGYATQTIEVKGQTTINVVMAEDSKVLDDLVVVGYGTIKRSDLTGSVSTVDTEKLNAKGGASVIQNLQGAVPGVNITQNSGRTNGGMNVEIRGKSSINSETKPMYIVDGIQCSDIDFLNPQDIERVDVLKDASSTAIYGSRATAGVLMITTKSGSNVSGKVNSKVSYDGYYGVSHVSRMPDFMNGQEWYRYRLLKFTQPASGSYSAQTAYSILPTSMGLGQALLQVSGGDIESPYLMKQMLANDETYDWPGMVTQDGHQQNHYLSVQGSSDKLNYHMGIGINDLKGVYERDEQRTYSFKGSVDAKVKSWFNAGFNMNLAQINNRYADDGAISQAYRVNPFMIPYDEEGNIVHLPGNKQILGTDTHQFSDFISPLHRLMNSEHKRKSYRLIGNIYAQFNIIQGLTLKSTFSPSYTNYRDGQYVGFTNPATGKTYVDNDSHTATFKTSTSYNWTWDNVLNYVRSFGDHSINAMGLFSSSKWNSESHQSDAVNPIEETLWWNLGSGNDGQTSATTGFSEQSMLSYAFRANYSYKGKYMFTGTVRWDGSSKFAHDYRWGSFPSLAVAWNIAEESFLQKQWLNNLKVRLSYGVTGNNSGISNYATIVGISSSGNYPFGSTYYDGFFPSGVVDQCIQWEKSHEINFGIDFGFLNNRISGSVELYNKKSKELLYKVDLPLEAGGGSMTTNIGSVRNQGVEINLTTTNITTSDWLWTTSLNFSANKNKVLQINGVSDKVIGGNASSCLFVGMPVNNIYSYVWDGIVSDKNMTVPDHQIAIDKGFTPGQTVRQCDYYYACYGLTEGQPIIRDVNGDGKWTDTDDRVVQNANPKWIGAFTSNLSYKLPKKGGSIDFAFSIYTKQGQKAASPTIGGDLFDYHDRGRGKINMDYYIPAGMLLDADGITADGVLINPVYQTTTHYGSWPVVNAGSGDGLGNALNYYNDSKFGGRQVCDASFWKVQNISLGYNFSKEIINKIGCQNLRLYVNVTNPFVWSKYKGFDPEWATASESNQGPSTVTYQFGANITF